MRGETNEEGYSEETVVALMEGTGREMGMAVEYRNGASMELEQYDDDAEYSQTIQRIVGLQSGRVACVVVGGRSAERALERVLSAQGVRVEPRELRRGAYEGGVLPAHEQQTAHLVSLCPAHSRAALSRALRGQRLAVACGSALLRRSERLCGRSYDLGGLPMRYRRSERSLALDAESQQRLCIPELLALVDTTQTAAGRRRLKAQLRSPSTDLSALRARHSLQKRLSSHTALRSAAEQFLGCGADIDGLLALVGRESSPSSPKAVASAHSLLQRVSKALHSVHSQGLAVHLPELDALGDARVVVGVQGRIRRLLDEEGAMPRDAHLCQPASAAVDAQVRQVHEADALAWASGGPLRVLRNGFGYRVPRTDLDAGLFPGAIRLRTRQGGQIAEVRSPALQRLYAAHVALEAQTWAAWATPLAAALSDLRGAADDLRRWRDACAELDVVLALTRLADASLDAGWCYPTLLGLQPEAGPLLRLEELRHPLLPASTQSPLTVTLDAGTRVWLIGGEHMAGKSTLLASVGLAVVLAQIGAVVPARCATLRLVDALCTRLGADDALLDHASALQWELRDFAAALDRAGPASLMLLDEPGRAAAPAEGLALASVLLETLLARGSAALLTSHMPLLQCSAAAYSAVGLRALRVDGGDRRLQDWMDQGAHYGWRCADAVGLSDLRAWASAAHAKWAPPDVPGSIAASNNAWRADVARLYQRIAFPSSFPSIPDLLALAVALKSRHEQVFSRLF